MHCAQAPWRIAQGEVKYAVLQKNCTLKLNSFKLCSKEELEGMKTKLKSEFASMQFPPLEHFVQFWASVGFVETAAAGPGVAAGEASSFLKQD